MKRPDTPCHDRYLNLGPLLHPLNGIECVSVGDFSCYCVQNYIAIAKPWVRFFNVYGVGVGVEFECLVSILILTLLKGAVASCYE